MTDKFLKAKHWQLFLLTFGIPMVFYFVMMGSVMSQFVTQSHPDPYIMFNYMKFFPYVMILFVVVLYGWMWSIAVGLQKKIPEGVSMKVKKFKVFFFIPMVYIFIFMWFFFFVQNGLANSDFEPNFAFIGKLFAVIVPLHLFSMFCMFYILYFVAKTFKTVELQRKATFSDFAGEFFLLWFFPIGIWIIQPKVNEMVRE